LTPVRGIELAAAADAQLRELLERLNDQYGRAGIERLRRWLLTEIPKQLAGRQTVPGRLSPHIGPMAPGLPEKLRPRYFYLSGLDDRAWHDADQVETARVLAENYEDIRRELAALEAENWRNYSGANPDWKVFRFYDYTGKVYADNARRCPKTAAVLDRVPRVQNAFFSRLTAGSEIKPHCGPWNFNLVVHLGLVVPAEGCGIEVAGETRSWKEGECLTFNDAWAHSAWNRSSHDRVVLLTSAWNPGLTRPEIEFLQVITKLMGGVDPDAQH
jgi:Aspartyl/Asparaginyl beta-hydroxylase